MNYRRAIIHKTDVEHAFKILMDLMGKRIARDTDDVGAYTLACKDEGYCIEVNTTGKLHAPFGMRRFPKKEFYHMLNFAIEILRHKQSEV